MPLAARAPDLQPVEAYRDDLGFVLTGGHGVIEVTDAVRNLMLLLSCPTLTIITAVTLTGKGGGGLVAWAFTNSPFIGPSTTVAPPLVTFWAFEVRLRRKNDSLRLV